MLKIRLQRVGRVHQPIFRLVLTDSKNSPKSGNFREILGNFDVRRPEKAQFNIEKIKFWISNGAKPSDTVFNLLIDKKIIEGKKINNLPKKSPIISEEMKAKMAEDVKAKEELQDIKVGADTPIETESKEEPSNENTAVITE